MRLRPSAHVVAWYSRELVRVLEAHRAGECDAGRVHQTLDKGAQAHRESSCCPYWREHQKHSHCFMRDG
jgi:hypothetical protein